MTNKKQTLRMRIAAHCRRHAHSIIIQMVAFSVITGFAMYEIRQTRNHVQSKFDRSFSELEEFSRVQARRIEYLAEKVKELRAMALIPVDAAADAYDKAQNYYEELRSKLKQSKWLNWEEVEKQEPGETVKQ